MVELMVVIIIMAILGLAIIPALMGSSDKAKYSRAWSDLTAISNAFTAFYGRVGNLPDVSIDETGAWTLAPGEGSEWTNAGITDETKAEALLQSFLGTPLDEIEDPWGNPYQLAGNWNSDTGKGHIIVYVKPGTGTGDGASASFGTGISVNAKKDPYNDDMPMAKLVINVPTGTGEETGD